MIRSFIVTEETTPQSLAREVAQCFEGVMRPESGVLKGGIIVNSADIITSLRWPRIQEMPYAVTLASRKFRIATIQLEESSYRELYNLYLAAEGRNASYLNQETPPLNMTPLAVRLPLCS